MYSHHSHTWTMYAPNNGQSSHLRTDNVRSLLDGLVLLRQGFHDGLDDLHVGAGESGHAAGQFFHERVGGGLNGGFGGKGNGRGVEAVHKEFDRHLQGLRYPNGLVRSGDGAVFLEVTAYRVNTYASPHGKLLCRAVLNVHSLF